MKPEGSIRVDAIGPLSEPTTACALQAVKIDGLVRPHPIWQGLRAAATCASGSDDFAILVSRNDFQKIMLELVIESDIKVVIVLNLEPMGTLRRFMQRLVGKIPHENRASELRQPLFSILLVHFSQSDMGGNQTR